MSPDRPASGALPATRADTVRERIAEAIVSGLLAPGERLDETLLAQRYGVSRTPVREALRQLAAIDLVESRPHRGAVVARLDGARMAELFEAMGEAEAACVRLAAIKAGAAEREVLERLHGACLVAMRGSAPDAIAVANRRWHEALYAAAHNGFLADGVVALRRRLAPFTRLQFRLVERPRDSAREHETVMVAVRQRDAEAAAAAMRRHVASVARAWQRWAAEAGDQPVAARRLAR